ncbi:MAG: two-component system response regulator [Rhodocyclales bacterium RIFCSPLOWO2_02_FULL_63_24]|nr:MAG: two-component system response regulator [Rhodocyclales bacterium RIFCSPLOWO2_02_FULL_63_24]
MANDMSDSILVIEDDDTFSATLLRALKRRGYAAEAAKSVAAALSLARSLLPARVVLDLNLDGASGLVLIPQLLELNPGCRIVVLTGYASIATAVDAIKLGAVQYLAKPVDVDTLLQAFGDAAAPGDVAAGAPAAVPHLPMSVERMEWEHIQRVLREHKGNISATARALNMHRRTLQRKLLKRPARK